MKDRAFMSSSPVELLEGWRLNQTRGLSLLATSVVEVEPELEPEVEPALEVHPPLPQAAMPRSIAAARVSARAFFIAILLFSCFK